MVEDTRLRCEPSSATEMLVSFGHRCVTKTPSGGLDRCTLVCLDMSEAPLSILDLFGGCALMWILSAALDRRNCKGWGRPTAACI